MMLMSLIRNDTMRDEITNQSDLRLEVRVSVLPGEGR
jgi:hypothetical protein